MDEYEIEHFVYVVTNDGEERHALQTRASYGAFLILGSWFLHLYLHCQLYLFFYNFPVHLVHDYVQDFCKKVHCSLIANHWEVAVANPVEYWEAEA